MYLLNIIDCSQVHLPLISRMRMSRLYSNISSKGSRERSPNISHLLYYSKRLELLKLYSLQIRREIYSMWKIVEDWFQTSLILSLALSLIVGEELVLYIMHVLVDWAP